MTKPEIGKEYTHDGATGLVTAIDVLDDGSLRVKLRVGAEDTARGQVNRQRIVIVSATAGQRAAGGGKTKEASGDGDDD